MIFLSSKKKQQNPDHLQYRPSFFSRAINSTTFTLLLTLALIIFYNTAFFHALFQAVNFRSLEGFLFGSSVALLAAMTTLLVMSLVVLPRIGKAIIIVILMCAACADYFMNAYGIVIHHTMIQNTLETDHREIRALFNSTLGLYILLLGIIPSILVANIKLQFGSLKQEIGRKLKLWAAAVFTIALLLICFSADYASFFRNNKAIRQQVNPVNFIYATVVYLSNSNKSLMVTPIATDAQLNALGRTLTKPTLFILVVGETARADHFSINGYHKPTTPRLAQQNIINYRKVTSCGTETAVSVPCMFSNLGREQYSDKKAKSQENLLDVIKHSGYTVLWRDNNSGCKGVCDRVEYEDVAFLHAPGLCNSEECFDNILLQNLETKILDMQGSKVVVLHQKGSHGPEYYRRYPENMEVFKPVCRVNKLQDCSNEEINNAFDNTIHYTDYFLNNTIEWLKSQEDHYNTALIYLSDHGESLGEKNMYLHGMPYVIAPHEQKHIPFLFWFSTGFTQENKINADCLHRLTNNEYSQDNLFHTSLGLLNIDTHVYNPTLDMISACREQ